MGNLLACCAKPINGHVPKPNGKALEGQQGFDGSYLPLQLSPSYPLKLTPCSIDCGDDDSDHEERGKIEQSGFEDLKELNFNSLKQPSFSCLKQRSFNNPKKKKKKKVTFDLNVKTYEVSSLYENIYSSDEEEEYHDIEEETRELLKEERFPTYPSNHRYNNCSRSDDENSDEHYEENDDGDEEVSSDYSDCDGIHDGDLQGEEDSIDSLFSLQIDKECQTFKEVSSGKAKSACSPEQRTVLSDNQITLDRCSYTQNVLRPVESSSQWREVKSARSPAINHLDKENVYQSNEPKILKGTKRSLRQSEASSHNLNQAVDTSFSSWLPRPRPSCDSQGSSCSGSDTSSTIDDYQHFVTDISKILMVQAGKEQHQGHGMMMMMETHEP